MNKNVYIFDGRQFGFVKFGFSDTYLCYIMVIIFHMDDNLAKYFVIRNKLASIND